MDKILLLGEINVNCYIIANNQQCYIVDPGYEKDKIKNYVLSKNLEVLGILLTHGHVDHIGAIDCFDVPVNIHKDEYEMLFDNYKNGFDYYDRKKLYSPESLNIVTFDDSKIFQLNEKLIEVYHTPGHTAGGVCYKFGQELYTGDTLFNRAVGRWDFPTGDLASLKNSIIRIIDGFDGDIEIFPGHGPASTIMQEKQRNQYYLNWKNEI